MPRSKLHTSVSKQRTGREYAQLHKWMDEGCRTLRHAHRIERHTPISDYQHYVEGRYGKRAVIEWLIHIALDNLDTACKLTARENSKPHSRMVILFGKNGIKKCQFE